jgi:fermentation-respiration switch protein FrsA (DUF1100 family)
MRSLTIILAAATFLPLALAFAATWMVLFPMLPMDLGGAENLDRKAERVRIAVPDGDSINGWYLPGNGTGTVLLLHGFGRTHSRMWRYGNFLHRAGYGILAIDFRSGRTLNRKPTTLGHYELIDAQAALDWLRARPDGHAGRIGVLGESLGASVAMMLAAGNPDVSAVVEDCGFATGKLALEESCERWAHIPRWPAAQVLRWVGRGVTGYDPGACDVVSAASALATRPVLFIQGMQDDRFSTEQVNELWRAAGSKDPLWLIAGAGHNEGWIVQRALYEQRVLTFFDSHLREQGSGIPPRPLASLSIPAPGAEQANEHGKKALLIPVPVR